MPVQQIYLGRGGSTPESYEYFYDGSTSTSMVIPGSVSFFKVAGVAAGSPGSNGPNSHTAGVPGNLVLSSDGSIGVSTESQYQETIPGWLTGRRPTTGQLYPRGVFNK